jgi:1,4-dihydroxy-2-naphthoate polyprenyltransferase
VTTAAEWFAGARPRTLSVAIAPVLVGTAIAHFEASARPLRAALALFVALALQVGVNYSNDYSDGIRGTDAERVGPARLVGQGLAAPAAVRGAALLSLGLAALGGLVLVLITGLWWLLLVGLISIGAAWTYTGGPHPYGYAGLGEVVVFTFFGLIAVTGTALVQVGSVSLLALAGGVGVGAVACAILVVNNLRDITTDEAAGKVTLAVRLGAERTRQLYIGLILSALAVAVLMTMLGSILPGWPLGAVVALLAGIVLHEPVRLVRDGATGPDLVVALSKTGKGMLVYGALLAAGIVVSVPVA